MSVRLGIVGCGVITERLLAHLSLPDARELATVVAMADPDRARVEMLADRYGGVAAFGDLETMLASSRLDAALVASPIQYHAPQVEACLAAGLHVHSQKTLATTGAEAQMLTTQSRSRGLRLAVSPGQMLLPAYQKARRLIRAGAIGTPFAVVAINSSVGHEAEPERSRGAAPSPAWYYRRGGGPLLDMGIYSIHALLGLFGAPTHVVGLAGRPLAQRRWREEAVTVEVDDNVQLLIRFPEDVLASLTTGFSAEPEIVRWGHLAISGSEGAIEIRRSLSAPGYEEIHRTSTDTRSHFFDHGLAPAHESLPEAHVYRDILDFLEAIVGGRPPGATPEDATLALSVVDAALRSSETKEVEPVVVP